MTVTCLNTLLSKIEADINKQEVNISEDEINQSNCEDLSIKSTTPLEYSYLPWMSIFYRLCTYYEDVLNLSVLVPCPIRHDENFDKISAGQNFNCLRPILILILGAAVQCEMREFFIGRIKQLSENHQIILANYIKQVVEEKVCDYTVSLDYTYSTDQYCDIFRRLYLDRSRLFSTNLNLIKQLEKQRGKDDLYNNFSSSEKDHQQLVKDKKDLILQNKLLSNVNEEKEAIIDKLECKIKEIEATVNKMASQNEVLSKALKDSSQIEVLSNEIEEIKLEKNDLKKKLRVMRADNYDVEFYKRQIEKLEEEKEMLQKASKENEFYLTINKNRIQNLMNELVQFQLQVEETVAEKNSLQNQINFLEVEKEALEFYKNKNSADFSQASSTKDHDVSLSWDMKHEHQQLIISELEEQNNNLKNELAQIQCRFSEQENSPIESQCHTMSSVEKNRVSLNNCRCVISINQKINDKRFLSNEADSIKNTVEILRQISLANLNRLKSELSTMRSRVDILQKTNGKIINLSTDTINRHTAGYLLDLNNQPYRPPAAEDSLTEVESTDVSNRSYDSASIENFSDSDLVDNGFIKTSLKKSEHPLFRHSDQINDRTPTHRSDRLPSKHPSTVHLTGSSGLVRDQSLRRSNSIRDSHYSSFIDPPASRARFHRSGLRASFTEGISTRSRRPQTPTQTSQTPPSITTDHPRVRQRLNNKWRGLVQRLVELQESNQEYILANSELRSRVGAADMWMKRTQNLEKENLTFQLENKKLSAIIETLQKTLTKLKSPNRYLYLTNV